jgi:hypothetical protein
LNDDQLRALEDASKLQPNTVIRRALLNAILAERVRRAAEKKKKEEDKERKSGPKCSKLPPGKTPAAGCPETP